MKRFWAQKYDKKREGEYKPHEMSVVAETKNSEVRQTPGGSRRKKKKIAGNNPVEVEPEMGESWRERGESKLVGAGATTREKRPN